MDALAGGKAVGWFQGRMEFGPRALGARSILGDPQSPTMQSVLNLKVKHRESFRPFAPSVLREDVADWFDLEGDSPYMLLVADVATRHRREMTPVEQGLFGIEKLNVPRSSIPAVTHVDIRHVFRPFTGKRTPATMRSFQRSRNAPAVRSSSTRASTSAANPSCARRRTRFGASWGPRLSYSSRRIAF